ncbi:Uncharacterized membrane protein YczE [Dethiosulfatibacter aminovorans DSM 17477]|uniref:Uncharacterized membrane protein YczE n=1 Tax=Dethiosulfatibacter aminovorans DSM 17477 TaxID=1121476 RepID=A0A1M6B433_9FIRM|nr:DUF6198 family protein [Dethiosulfatibacter aminovorans]SHI43368.1 Uncharacterized membrane protein YczE [Dethiosulfatibacter aminovorans DSM 17477]
MKIAKKIFVYCLGLFFLALGVTFSIKSQLGISPVNSIPYIWSLISGIEQGHLIIVVFSSFILLQIVLLRRKFNPINLLQIVFSTIFGYFVTLTNYMFVFMSPPESYIMRLVFLFISMVLVAIGIILYLRAALIPLPAEGCMLAINEVTGMEFHRIKSFFDTTMVVVAAALSLLFLGGLIGVREGTIIAAVGIGKIIGVLNKIFKNQIERLDEFINGDKAITLRSEEC